MSRFPKKRLHLSHSTIFKKLKKALFTIFVFELKLRHSKIWKKLKNALFKAFKHSLLSSRFLKSQFLRSSLWPNFDLRSYERLASLSQKMVSISSLKICKKLKNDHFKRQNIRFWAQESSETIFSQSSNDEILIEIVLNAMLGFPREWFQLRHSKTCKKNWKMPFSNAQNIHFWAQISSKTVF